MRFEDVFNTAQIASIYAEIDACDEREVDHEQGRLMIHGMRTSASVNETVRNLVNEETGLNLYIHGGPLCAVYSSEFGEPNLVPHYDGDDNMIVFDYQLKSNTSWGIGVDLGVEELVDNSAIAFDPNETIHWRPHKKFEEGERIIMLFFRLFDVSQIERVDRRLDRKDPAFDAVRAFRDSL